MVVDRPQRRSNPKVMKSRQGNMHFPVSSSRFNPIFDATEDTPTKETLVVPIHEKVIARTTTPQSRLIVIAKRHAPPIARQPLHKGMLPPDKGGRKGRLIPQKPPDTSKAIVVSQHSKNVALHASEI
ncbi:hypothetical protein V6N13_047994 [Hibiscus sabdariffa]|uniref:Uncharacterized protein n=1 Tax=Hibiscus sabdariffa TaxID=183260 RepID=A0ABR2F5Z8_9ROSI